MRWLWLSGKNLYLRAAPSRTPFPASAGSILSSSFRRSDISKGPEGWAQYIIRLMSGLTGAVSITRQVPQLESAAQQLELLEGGGDSYGGVIVEMKQPMDSKVFGPLLRTSLSHWEQQGKKGIWMKLPIELANLVEAAVKEGFRYHHAEPEYLMLVYWIPKTLSTLPANASHRIGIGALVVNDKGQLLVVQEKSGRFRGTGVWKLPTGVVNEGESICAAAVREVKEETGIETEFVEVLSFRESHKSFFGKSDLFFVCMLRPHSFDIQKQIVEIAAAQWMPAEEYAAQPFVREHKLFDYVAKICLAKLGSNYTGFSAVSSTTSSGKTSCLYFNERDMN